jgi:oxygen-dependent protoporphyrinogen oxidase
MKIAILGGGISGLTSAWTLQNRHPGAEITLYESSDRLGGWIQTTDIGGYLFEKGPRSCRTNGTGIHTLQLAKELNLLDEIIIPSPEAFIRYLYIGGKLKMLPNGLFSFLTTPWLLKHLPAIIKEPFNRQRADHEETVVEFFTRRFSRRFCDQLIDPMVAGIYAGDVNQLSMKAAFPSVDQWEKKSGSVLKGVFTSKRQKLEDPQLAAIQSQGLFTFKQGMETLVHALKSKLQIDIRTGTPVVKIKSQSDRVEIHTPHDSEAYDHVISSLPAHTLLPMMGEEISGLSFTSLAVIHIGYKQQVLQYPGFGYLIPSSEKNPLLGVVFDSMAFPEQNRNPNETRMTVMMGGAHRKEIIDLSTEEIKQLALEGVEKQLGVKTSPDVAQCYVYKNAIPQYLPGHGNMVEKVSKLWPNITILGNSFHGVSVNDCIASARRGAEILQEN